MRTAFLQKWRWRLQISLAAFVGISFQLCGFRAISFYLDSSLQSVTFTLCLYFGGLLTGVVLLRMFPKRLNRFVAAAAATFLGVFLVLVLIRFDELFSQSLSWYARPLLGKLSVSALLLFPAALANGILFPCLYSLRPTDHTDVFPIFLAVDLAGSLAACLWVGFIGLPYLGFPSTLLIAGGLSILLATTMVPGAALVGFAALGAHIVLLRDVSPSVPYREQLLSTQSLFTALSFLGEPDELKLVKSIWSSFGQLSVIDSPDGNRSLVLNRRLLCAIPPRRSAKVNQTSEDTIGRDTLHALQGLSSPEDYRVANVGLGCGITTKALLDDSRVKILDVVEINPEIVSLLPLFAARVGLPKSEPRLNLVTADATDFFKAPPRRYHAIVIDVEEPSIPYSSALYTVAFLNQAKSALAPGGVLSLWNPSGVSKEYLAILYSTLRSQFPVVYLKVYGKSREKFDALQSAIGFFASEREIEIESFGLTDSDLLLTSTIAHLSAPRNTSGNMALLRQWNRDHWSDIWK